MCQKTHTVRKKEQESPDEATVNPVESSELENKTMASDSFSLEQYEAQEIYCDNYCSKESNIHTHDSVSYKKYRGMDDIELTENIKCELCEYISKDKSHHEEHFEHEHGEEEWTVGCVFPKCEFETPSPEDLIKHFQANHDKWIQKSIKKKCLRLISG